MNHNEPKRAACAGMWDLFDSTHPSDHARAKAICNSPCPIKLQCAQWLKEDKASVGYDPHGTWAGRLVGRPVGRPSRRKGAA